MKKIIILKSIIFIGLILYFLKICISYSVDTYYSRIITEMSKLTYIGTIWIVFVIIILLLAYCFWRWPLCLRCFDNSKKLNLKLTIIIRILFLSFIILAIIFDIFLGWFYIPQYRTDYLKKYSKKDCSLYIVGKYKNERYTGYVIKTDMSKYAVELKKGKELIEKELEVFIPFSDRENQEGYKSYVYCYDAIESLDDDLIEKYGIRKSFAVKLFGDSFEDFKILDYYFYTHNGEYNTQRTDEKFVGVFCNENTGEIIYIFRSKLN